MDEMLVDFDQVYRLYYASIATYMKRMVGVEDADDVTQEVFAKIESGLKKFEGRAKLSTWIYRIATNAALDRLRKKRNTPPDIPLMEADQPNTEQIIPSSSNPLELVIQAEMNDCIREQVDKLPEKYKTVMILSSLKELKNREIADILDISLDNVKIRLHRARTMLRKILETECRFYLNPSTGVLSCDRKF